MTYTYITDNISLQELLTVYTYKISEQAISNIMQLILATLIERYDKRSFHI